MTKEEQKHAYKWIEHMTKLTVRLSTYNERGSLVGRASGFLYRPEGRQVPVIITAGHKLSDVTRSFIQTRIIRNEKTMEINTGKLTIFYNNKDIDYAYCELPVDLYQKEIEEYAGVEFLFYQHQFVPAVKDEAYGFAVVNDYAEFVRNAGGEGFRLPSYYCYELYMELEQQEEHINYFKLSRPFQGHEFYQGASGSPIADTAGAINSILVGGCEKSGLLRAFRLDNITIGL